MEGGEEGRGTQIVKNYLMKFSSARFSDCSKMAQKIASLAFPWKVSRFMVKSGSEKLQQFSGLENFTRN